MAIYAALTSIPLPRAGSKPENGVSVIMVKCPNTGRELSTGIETDRAGFDRLPRLLTYSRCPLCRLEHAWWKREAWLAESDPFEATDTAA